ncbi:MAG: hydrolase [Anaerovoracaceae bacterium]
MKKMEMFKKLVVDREDTIAIMIDMQEKLLPVMQNAKKIEETAIKLTKGLKLLEIPILVTQQYTKGIGETKAEIAEVLGEFTPIEKDTFSAMKTDEFVAELEVYDQTTAVVFGIEAHICLVQTVMDLLKNGYDVFVVADACSSRSQMDYETSLRRMAQAGAFITTYESVLYELMETSNDPEFKKISKIVK